jgi:two-component system response regulator RegA
MNVLIIDDSGPARDNLGATFVALGHSVWVHSDFDIETVASVAGSIDLIVAEQAVNGTRLFKVHDSVRRHAPGARVAVATVYPSVASAVEAIRIGCDAYLAKPVTASSILCALNSSASGRGLDSVLDGGGQWPSLDRTIWEYLNQVYVSAGSMSEAARRLGLDRRSLRRMLSKYPPAK